MDSNVFDSLVKKSFENKAKFPLLKRIKMVNLTEDDLPETTSTVVIADIVKDEEYLAGTFEFVPMNVPNIKCGVNIQGSSNKRLTSIAESLGIASNQRLTELVVAFMTGKSNRLGVYVKSEVSSALHTTSELDLEKVSTAVKNLKETQNLKYDRATLSGKLLSTLTKETGVVQAKKVFKLSTGLKAEIDDSFIKEKDKQGNESTIHTTVPENTIILSNSKLDNSDIFYLANLPVTEPVSHQNTFGVIGYTTEKYAWSILRAIPVLTEPTAFATITCQ